MTEDAMIKRMERGDTIALAAFMSQYQDYVYSILHGMLRPQEAPEAAQDTFLKAFRSIGQYQRESMLSTWLYTIAYRTGLDYIRKRKDNANLDDISAAHTPQSDISSSRSVEQKELSQQLHRYLLQLKPEDAAIIKMYYLKELNIQEIAEITTLSVSNLKVKLHRSRKALKNMMTQSSDQLIEYIQS